MIDVGLYLCGGRCRSRRQHLLSSCVDVMGQLVVIGRLVLILQPGDGAVLVHGGCESVV